MKKIGILAITAMLFVGLMACEQKAGEGEGNENAGTENTAGTTAGTSENAGNTGGTEATPEEALPLTTVEFMEDSHNFGEIPEGEKVSHVFKFRNSGQNPLKVENVKPSCGCTTPDWSKDPIPPGEEGFVTVEFNSQGKTGAQKKSVTVLFNNTDPKNKILNFTGEVIAN
jgi:hypothetical protein